MRTSSSGELPDAVRERWWFESEHDGLGVEVEDDGTSTFLSDHITPWHAHGPTALHNLELRCRHHHLATHQHHEHEARQRRE